MLVASPFRALAGSLLVSMLFAPRAEPESARARAIHAGLFFTGRATWKIFKGQERGLQRGKSRIWGRRGTDLNSVFFHERISRFKPQKTLRLKPGAKYPPTNSFMQFA